MDVNIEDEIFGYISYFIYNILCVDVFFFFQAEDGIRDLVRSRGLGDVYKRQPLLRWNDYVSWNRLTDSLLFTGFSVPLLDYIVKTVILDRTFGITTTTCLLYTSDAADDLLCVDLGGRRSIKKKKKQTISYPTEE